MPRPGAVDVVRVDEGHFLVVGGYDGVMTSRHVFAFREALNDWIELPSLCTERSATAGVLAGKYLCLFGDYENPDEILVYDMVTKSSETFRLGYVKSRHAAALTVGGRIFVVGGKAEKADEPHALIQEFALRPPASGSK